jgi:chromosome partitioning protein
LPVLVTANPKGGAGKSTSTLVLATTLAAQDLSVSVLDCDPNRPIVKWESRRTAPSPFTVHGNVTEHSVIKLIEAERASRDFVFVDLEGTASRLTSRAISRADLVLVPIQPSPLDSEEGARALALVAEEEEDRGRSIRSAVVLTRTNPAIPTKQQQAIVAGLTDAGITLFGTCLHQRAAYQAMFSEAATLDELLATPGLKPKERTQIETAKANALALAQEIFSILLPEQAADEPSVTREIAYAAE